MTKEFLIEIDEIYTVQYKVEAENEEEALKILSGPCEMPREDAIREITKWYVADLADVEPRVYEAD